MSPTPKVEVLTATRARDPSEANAQRIRSLYLALQNGEALAAAACYAEDSYFEDIGFRLKGRRRIGEMWAMVCDAKRLVVDFSNVVTKGNRGRASWVAAYPPIIATRARKKNPAFDVINPSKSTFVFSDDSLILEHRDECDARAWANQAFPFPISVAMGNIGLLRRWMAGAKLARHVRQHPSDFG